jgi:hypothetical protein
MKRYQPDPSRILRRGHKHWKMKMLSVGRPREAVSPGLQAGRGRRSGLEHSRRARGTEVRPEASGAAFETIDPGPFCRRRLPEEPTNVPTLPMLDMFDVSGREAGEAASTRRGSAGAAALVSWHGPSLEGARLDAMLSVEELWIRYIGNGGTATVPQFRSFLGRDVWPGTLQYDITVSALNDRFGELHADHPVPYADES